MARDMLDWATLTCDSCGGSPRFLQVIHIKWREGGGAVNEPAGYACQECGALVDVGRLIDRAKLDQKKKEFEAMKQQFEPGLPPAPAPVAKK